MNYTETLRAEIQDQIQRAYVAETRVLELEEALRRIDNACCRSECGAVGPDAEYPDPIPPDPIEITSICRQALAGRKE